LEEIPVLYVKSKKIEQVEHTLPYGNNHPCHAADRATKTYFVRSEEDEKAIELLNEAKLNFKLVDICLANPIARFKAKINGVNATPTLVYNGQKFKGLHQITEMLESTRK